MIASTLGSISDTSDKRIASFASWTGTDWVSIVQFTDGLHTTWRWITWIRSNRNGGTANISIALEARFAAADWVVIGKVADGVVTAEPRTH